MVHIAQYGKKKATGAFLADSKRLSCPTTIGQFPR